ncbi:type II toxin-antitoxin system VapC family toxin [uncultured Sphingomonas sp.]|uniref:type II toxin-antitoxin system VapC family toxin n=1 Tax=uncultured Sphingomonas sp. TaxID=158754 RepID=UPI0035CB4627
MLLDTHALLWAFTAPSRLPADVRVALYERTATVLVSAISAYEVAFKYSLGKLDEAEALLADFDQRLADQEFEVLAVTHRHALAAGRLELHHRDPFDRLLIAQALVEDVELVSNEKLFDRYGVSRLW